MTSINNLKSAELNLQKIILFLNFLPFVVVSVISLSIPIIFQFLPQKLPLFYSLPWGDKQLANLQQFFILPASIILITLINLILSWNLHQSQFYFKIVLLISSLIFSLILTISFLKIISIFM